MGSFFGHRFRQFTALASIAFYSCRKGSLIANCLIGISGAVISGVCILGGSNSALYIGRFISGLNAGITIGVASMYLTEIAPQHLRGMIGACHQLAVTVGICVSYVVTFDFLLNTPDNWAYAIAIGLFPCAFGLVALPFCPESARYLILVKKDEEAAKRALAKAQGNSESNAEAFYAEMRAEQETARDQPTFHSKYLFTKPEFRKPIAIAILIQILQQFSGINAVGLPTLPTFFIA